jgi:hypothetical protein
MIKLLFAGAMVILGVLGFGTARLLNTGQQVEPTVSNTSQEVKPSLETLRNEATRVQPGVATEKQKEHRKLYKYYNIAHKGKKLVDRGKGVHDVRVVIGEPMAKPIQNVLTPQEFLHQLSCKSDAIAIVKVVGKESQLTEDEDFIFSDYSVKVVELLKNNEKDSIYPDSVMIITRPGGTVSINGRIIQAIDSEYKEMRKNNEYLLFLSYIPMTKSYKAVDAKSSFDLQGDGGQSVANLTSLPTFLDYQEEFKNRNGFIIEVSNAINLRCK